MQDFILDSQFYEMYDGTYKRTQNFQSCVHEEITVMAFDLL